MRVLLLQLVLEMTSLMTSSIMSLTRWRGRTSSTTSLKTGSKTGRKGIHHFQSSFCSLNFLLQESVKTWFHSIFKGVWKMGEHKFWQTTQPRRRSCCTVSWSSSTSTRYSRRSRRRRSRDILMKFLRSIAGRQSVVCNRCL